MSTLSGSTVSRVPITEGTSLAHFTNGETEHQRHWVTYSKPPSGQWQGWDNSDQLIWPTEEPYLPSLALSILLTPGRAPPLFHTLTGRAKPLRSSFHLGSHHLALCLGEWMCVEHPSVLVPGSALEEDRPFHPEGQAGPHVFPGKIAYSMVSGPRVFTLCFSWGQDGVVGWVGGI